MCVLSVYTLKNVFIYIINFIYISLKKYEEEGGKNSKDLNF